MFSRTRRGVTHLGVRSDTSRAMSLDSSNSLKFFLEDLDARLEARGHGVHAITKPSVVVVHVGLHVREVGGDSFFKSSSRLGLFGLPQHQLSEHVLDLILLDLSFGFRLRGISAGSSLGGRTSVGHLGDGEEQAALEVVGKVPDQLVAEVGVLEGG